MSNLWNYDEKEILRYYYPREGIAVAAMLPRRTKEAIKQQAQVLGVQSSASHKRFTLNEANLRKIAATRRAEAKNRGVTWEIPLEYAVLQMRRDCHYCGSPPSGRANGTPMSGLDRINPEFGYVDGNVVACCWTCNDSRGRMTADEWFRHMRKILNFAPTR